MDGKTHSQVAFAMLVAAKVFGIAGLILGVTRYRILGGALLGLDAVMIVVAIAIGLRGMRSVVREEETHKKLLAKMIEEGTLRQYLRDLGAPAVQTRDLEAALEKVGTRDTDAPSALN